MPKILAVPHRQQEIKAGCLPACAQMALAYCGIEHPQAELSRLLGTRPDIGTPHSRITRLRSDSIQVVYQEANGLADLRDWLNRDLPIIVFVQASELPHWRIRSQHAVVAVGIDQDAVYVLDPGITAPVIAIPLDDFLLAWEEMDLTYAVIAKR